MICFFNFIYIRDDGCSLNIVVSFHDVYKSNNVNLKLCKSLCQLPLNKTGKKLKSKGAKMKQSCCMTFRISNSHAVNKYRWYTYFWNDLYTGKLSKENRFKRRDGLILRTLCYWWECNFFFILEIDILLPSIRTTFA